MPKGVLSKETRLQQNVTRLKRNNTLLIKERESLRREIKEKDARIKELENKLEDKEAQRRQLQEYLYSPKRANPQPKAKGKKQGAPAFHRPKPKDEDVTEEHTYSIHQCPACKGSVGKAVDTTVKYEEDIELVPRKTVKKHTLTRHWCPSCETFVRSVNIPPISRIGPNVMAYILYARYRLRLTQALVRQSLLDLYGFRISEGEIAEKLKEAEGIFGKDYEAVSELIRLAKVVYADETGWRMDGENWWLWVFVTEKGTRYRLEMTRGKGPPEEALGGKKDRIIVSDGYRVYAGLPGEKQQCWVHLIRAARNASTSLHEDIVCLYLALGEELVKPVEKRRRSFFEESLQVIAESSYQEHSAKKVQNRIQNHIKELLTCLDYVGVLPENNTAERAIRPQVVMRKIFGNCRSMAGARAHEVNSSVIETYRRQNHDSSFFDIMVPLIQKRRSEL